MSNSSEDKGRLHLLKLCVGADDVEDLKIWQTGRGIERARLGLDPRPRHTTRMWPKRADEVLSGGSLYWVIKGVIAARQRLEAVDEVIGEDGIRRCDLVLNPRIVLTSPAPRRPFQGWRYLRADEAPRDLSRGSSGDAGLPETLRAAVAEYGVL